MRECRTIIDIRVISENYCGQLNMQQVVLTLKQFNMNEFSYD